MSQRQDSLEQAMTSPFLTRVDAIQMHMYEWAKSTVQPNKIRVYKLDDPTERAAFTDIHKICFGYIMDSKRKNIC